MYVRVRKLLFLNSKWGPKIFHTICFRIFFKINDEESLGAQPASQNHATYKNVSTGKKSIRALIIDTAKLHKGRHIKCLINCSNKRICGSDFSRCNSVDNSAVINGVLKSPGYIYGAPSNNIVSLADSVGTLGFKIKQNACNYYKHAGACDLNHMPVYIRMYVCKGIWYIYVRTYLPRSQTVLLTWHISL